MSSLPFPITGTKIHPPLLRSDTLSRPRLTDWLERATAGRLGLIVAEAGFGKTTLLADWSSKTRRRIAWYRLEPDDRDWLVFLRHLVASGRELDPDFGTETLELIMSLGTGGPTQQDLAASIVREFVDFGAALPDGLTVVFDDHHVIDGSPETDAIVRALVERTGDGLSVVIASRAVPKLPLSKVRARGGVHRLDDADLRFDAPETERLFREAYHHPLEPDVVSDLAKRTEGWPALLTLVRTSLEDKDAPEARALVAQLSTTRGDLYDFLAEEVLASLSPEMQRFLTRVSVLVSVDVACAAIVDDGPGADPAARIIEAESLGLLSRPDRESPHRFHPLVRDFLHAHLAGQIGQPAVRGLHRRVAESLEPTDWFGAAWHYRAAGLPGESARVIDAALPEILASGAFAAASGFLDGSAGSEDRAAVRVLLSRLAVDRGNYDLASKLAQQAVEGAPPELAGTARLNLGFVRSLFGYGEDFVELAQAALQDAIPEWQSDLAEAALVLVTTQTDGSLQTAGDLLTRLAAKQERIQHLYHAGVTYHNLAMILYWQGRTEEALASALRSENLLERSASQFHRTGASIIAAACLARLGRIEEARRRLAEGANSPSAMVREETSYEGANILLEFGAIGEARDILRKGGGPGAPSEVAPLRAMPEATIALQAGDVDAARAALGALAARPLQDVAGLLRIRLLETRIALVGGDANLGTAVSRLEALALRQGSEPALLCCSVLSALRDRVRLSRAVEALPPHGTYVLSTLAEEMCGALDGLTPDARERVEAEAALRPDRWRPQLRKALVTEPSGVEAAAILARVGDASDAAVLRDAAKTNKRLRPMAREATRRLAEPVLVHDLGNVQIELGSRRIEERLRRKVVGLLCFLTSRPGMSATRDEAIEALWSELGGDTAGNSLHQTIYFLRRVFEPDFREGLSADYIEFDGEMIRLDKELVDSESRRVWRLVEATQSPPTERAEAILDSYSGRYALDFMYDEWSVPYRETLHAAVLGVVEAALVAAASARDDETAIRLARRLIAVDPTADAIELELLRAHKRAGRPAAAAEQYAHYASVLRDELGVEPPEFGAL